MSRAIRKVLLNLVSSNVATSMRVLVFGPQGQKDDVFLTFKSANDDSYTKTNPPELSEQGGGQRVGILGPPGGGDQGGDLSHLPTYLGLKTGTKEQARATSHTKHDKQKHKSQDIHSN